MNKLGDNVHLCGTPSTTSTHFDISPSSIIALLAPSVIIFIILRISPLTPISDNFFHNPFLHTV